MQLKNIKQAIVMYYSKIEIGTPEIIELFGCSKSGAHTLKKKARELQAKNKVPAFDPHLVNTYCAFEAWDLCIEDLERRYKKLVKIEQMKGA